MWIETAQTCNARPSTTARAGFSLAFTSVVLLIVFGLGQWEARGQISPRVVSNGGAPFTESWDQMVRRDQQQRTVQQGQPPRIDEAPLRTIDIQRAVSSENPFPWGEANHGPVVEAPQTIGTTFQTISLQDQAFDLGQFSIPPDTMGAVGPSHFLEVINSSVAIYAKTGSRLSHVKLDTFFTLTIGATTYPRNGSFDPRVLDVGDPSSGTTFFTDYSTLGTDDNGVYFGMAIFPSAGAAFAKIVATNKATLLAGSPSLDTVFQFTNITDLFSSPQPALNFDSTTGAGPQFFVASSTTVFGNVNYRSAVRGLSWPGT